MITSSEKGCNDPGHAYQQYSAAIEQRDLAGVLGKLSDGYGCHLRAAYRKSRFPALFELWCETFPRLIGVVAYFIDGNCATVELLLKCDNGTETGYAVMLRDGEGWCVDFEHRANGRTRIPSGRLVSERLRSAFSPTFVSKVFGMTSDSHATAFRRTA